MKTVVICVLYLLSFNTIYAQQKDASVEKSVFGVQTGLLGIWANNESRLSNSIVLRTELGMDAGIFGNDIYNSSGYILGFVITAEPRWYYNLNRRQNKSKRIDGNSGNFISLKTSYHPDWFYFSSDDNVKLIADISIIPTYGIRRNIGKHFNYEAGFGIGYIEYLNDNDVIILNESDVAVNLHLRLGYRF
ncbi:hypothetical protein [Psychroserpens sp. SPM9]|uniref:hypothetical protein n=1 Tax=Psychroserpens sp. SPM9 TaxID=2975598 RepID=UPI0021A3FFDF|nr:hypothetical protein [Psychroserpens sp. SPM9]MDG5490435.1 hypothetical protein [Psychroserpens sp. SPM9]